MPLASEQQQACRNGFSLSACCRIPYAGSRIAQKWSSVEKENSPSPIAGLRWIRESTMSAMSLAAPFKLTLQVMSLRRCRAGDLRLILTNASLIRIPTQKCHARRLQSHELRTPQVHGPTGSLLHFFEDWRLSCARQKRLASNERHVAKANGSNRIHYDVTARAAEVVLVVQAALEPTTLIVAVLDARFCDLIRPSAYVASPTSILAPGGGLRRLGRCL